MIVTFLTDVDRDELYNLIEQKGLPQCSLQDAGKILKVSSDGVFACESITTEEWVFTLEDGTTVTKRVMIE